MTDAYRKSAEAGLVRDFVLAAGAVISTDVHSPMQPPRFSTAQDLSAKQFEPVRWIVPGIVAEGVTLLAGKPKLGKSWLCLDIALAVATGSEVLGGVACDQGDVLYLALEDNERRLQQRLRKLQPDGAWPDKLCYATECPTLDRGGAEHIQQWVQQVQRPRLVIVDVMARLTGPRDKKETLYEQDYKSIQALSKLASSTGLAVVLVHHTRKTTGIDRLDSVSGSTGLTGAMDTVMVLDKADGLVTLYGRGRDVEEIDIALSFDAVSCRWTKVGDPEALKRSAQRNAVMNLLNANPTGMAPKDVSDALDLTDAQARQLLKRMADVGEVEKLAHGIYGPAVSQLSLCHDGAKMPAVAAD
jgi:hypothetical protein